MPFSAGLQVGPYRIMEQLGQGGMATVYQAYHAALDRYVAIKVLHQAFMEDPNFLARFQREARLVAKLEHPNIVPIYDYAEYEGQPYLVMKFIEGDTLKARLHSGPLNAGEVSRMVELVGSALTYAHKQGILHRDIKPSNVILANDGQVYLADFGLARIAQSGESTLTTDMVLGTPQYISPEQAMAKKDLDEGTDIYSFGVMIYEMTVGRVPFSGDTPFSVIHDHIYSPLPMPSSVNPNVSPDLERFLLKTLAKERNDRFKDVPDMVKAFNEAWTQAAASVPGATATIAPPAAAAGAGPVTPPPAAPAETVMRAQKSKRIPTWMWVSAAVLLCLCCLVAAMILRQRDNATPPAGDIQPTVDAASTPTPPAEGTEAVANATMELPQLSLEQARQQVEQNPNDPKAHLQYGYALIEDGQEAEGYRQIHQGAALAPRNQLFLVGAAKTFEELEEWLGAAILYVQMAENARTMPNVLINGLHQAVYRGFEEEIAPEVLDYGRIGRIDEALGLMAQARHSLANRDDTALAQGLIEQLEALKAGLPETKLLRAELLIQEEKTSEAQRILHNLVDAPGTPAWIKDYAEELLDTIQ
jgi:tRNA A-37 threonylcarbamoyl transferase component Bud32